MCGISGISLRQGDIDRIRLGNSIAALKHRGPDDNSTYIDHTLGLAHTRLAIIDLAGGQQPLYSDDRTLVLVANGEIYNYIELRQQLATQGFHCHTGSDCEVLIQAYRCYGEHFIERLEGMFAFALYDSTQQRLILARDRLGIKPLFIAHLGNGIAFASEIKALLPCLERRPSVNADALGQYLQQQFSSGRGTLLEGVERIDPAEYLVIEHGAIRQRRHYWSALTVTPQTIGLSEACRQFDGLMETVMQQHMRSDVPFGLFLSGGVDSALLLALLDHYGAKPVRTFSVGFAGTDLVDELPLAEQIAKRFNSAHTSLRPRPEELLFSMADCVWLADDLMRDYANLPTNMLARAAGRELKVVFSGEGGDEVFAGYGRYRSGWLERRLKALLRPGSGGYRTSTLLTTGMAKRLLSSELQQAAGGARRLICASWQQTPRQWSDLQRMQYVDLVHALPNNLLVKADRMLMGSGLEGRVPFLDHRLVEFGLSLPDDLKIQGKQGKWFLKHWAERWLPQTHLHAKKRGFHVPVAQWLGDRLQRQLLDILPRNRAIRHWFKADAVSTLLRHGKPNSVNTRIIWSLLEFALWHRMFMEGDGSRPPAQIDPIDIISD